MKPQGSKLKQEKKVEEKSSKVEEKKEVSKPKKEEPVKEEKQIKEEKPKKQEVKEKVEVKEKEKSPKKMEEKEAKKENKFIHKGIKCNVCSVSDIKGSRFKCTTCYDYDLCSECYLNSKHKTGKEHKGKNHKFL